MIAVVGSPAERQLRKVARADYEAALLVGEVHEHLRTLARLAVLIGHVLHRGIVADIGEVLFDRRPNGNLAEAHPERLGERLGIRLGTHRGAEARHRRGRDAIARKPERIEGTHGHEQRKRGVEPAREADDRALGARMGEARLEAGGLQAQDLLAALGKVARINGHERSLRKDAVDIKRREHERRRGGSALPRSRLTLCGCKRERHLARQAVRKRRGSPGGGATALVAENGSVLAKTPLFSCEMAVADVDLDRLCAERRRSTTWASHW